MAGAKRSLPIYMLCSTATACLEFVVGWFLLQVFPNALITTNVVAILLSSVLHYALITKFAFETRRNIENALVYVITFFLGLVLQNLVIWFSYEVMLTSLVEVWRYAISKAASLAIPFFVLYFIRKTLNERISEKASDNGSVNPVD